jgi:hypothetical protein
VEQILIIGVSKTQYNNAKFEVIDFNYVQKGNSPTASFDIVGFGGITARIIIT